MTQREKDRITAEQHINPYTCDARTAFADGAEYGRKDLAKLERLVRAGWEVTTAVEGFCLWFPDNKATIDVFGATLAEALAQVEDP